MGKKTQTNTQTQQQTLDPATQAYVDKQRTAAGQAYSDLGQFAGGYTGGTDPNLTNAAGGFNAFAQSGDLGRRALAGDPEALNQIMGPLSPYFNHALGAAVNTANQNETLQGGGFGSRSALAAGRAIGDVTNQQLLEAYNRAGSLANLGMGANQSLAGIGQYLQNFGFNNFLNRESIPGQQIGILNAGLGPYGMTTTNTTKTQSDPWAQLLGLGLTAAGTIFGGPAGGAAASRVAGGSGISPGSIPQLTMPSTGYDPRQYGGIYGMGR